jgi:hypothetical protein
MISQQFLGFKNLSFVGDSTTFRTAKKLCYITDIKTFDLDYFRRKKSEWSAGKSC